MKINPEVQEQYLVLTQEIPVLVMVLVEQEELQVVVYPIILIHMKEIQTKMILVMEVM